MGITRLSNCEAGKLLPLSGIYVVIIVASAIVDATLNFSIDDVWLSEDDGVIIALSVKPSKSLVLDESTTAYDVLFETIIYCLSVNSISISCFFYNY